MQPQNKNFHPDIALASSLAAINRNEKVANRVPGLKLSAYILIGLTGFAAAQTFTLRQVMVDMLGSSDYTRGFALQVTEGVWAATILGCIIVLLTKSTRLVKIIMLIFGCSLAYDLVIGFMHFDIVGTGINVFVVWWTYNLYQSVEALEIKV